MIVDPKAFDKNIISKNQTMAMSEQNRNFMVLICIDLS